MADMSEFDQAAEKANEDLQKIMKDMKEEERTGILELAQWWKDHYMKAGHKRLGRILVQIAKAQ